MKHIQKKEEIKQQPKHVKQHQLGLHKPDDLVKVLQHVEKTYVGVDYMIELRCKRNTNEPYRYYCELCGEGVKDAVQHLTSNLHIFRYCKVNVPIQYERIINESMGGGVQQRSNDHIAISCVKRMLSLASVFQKRVFRNAKPKVQELEDLEKHYYDYIQNKKEHADIFIEHSHLIQDVNVELSRTTQKLAINEQANQPPVETLLTNIKQERRSPERTPKKEVKEENSQSLFMNIKNEPMDYVCASTSEDIINTTQQFESLNVSGNEGDELLARVKDIIGRMRRERDDQLFKYENELWDIKRKIDKNSKTLFSLTEEEQRCLKEKLDVTNNQ